MVPKLSTLLNVYFVLLWPALFHCLFSCFVHCSCARWICVFLVSFVCTLRHVICQWPLPGLNISTRRKKGASILSIAFFDKDKITADTTNTNSTIHGRPIILNSYLFLQINCCLSSSLIVCILFFTDIFRINQRQFAECAVPGRICAATTIISVWKRLSRSEFRVIRIEHQWIVGHTAAIIGVWRFAKRYVYIR